MTRKNAEILLQYIESLKFTPNTDEDKFITLLKSKFQQGYSHISQQEANVLQNLYSKAAGGGDYENKQYIGKRK